MAESKTELLVGAAVLAAAVAFVFYATRGADGSRQADQYPLHASFRSVEGISVGTDVRLAGVKIGTVIALDLNPQTFFADATFSVDEDILVPTDSTVLVSSEGLLGGNFIEIQPGGATDNVEPGGEIEDTQGSVSVVTLLMKFVGGGDAAASGGATE